MHIRIALSSVLLWIFVGTTFSALSASRPLTAQEPVVLSGHNGAVMMAEFVQGTGRVVTASADQTAGLWDVAAGKRIQTYAQHTGPLYSLAVSRDGRTLVTGAQDNTLRVWDLPMSLPLVRLAEMKVGLTDLSLSPDGRSLIVTTADGQVRTLDLSTQPAGPGARTGHGPEATCAAWKSDGSVFATGDSSGRIFLWSPDLEAPLSILSAQQSPITSLQFINGNQQLLSLSADGAARTWQLMTPPARTLYTADSMLVNMVPIPGQNQVLVVTERGALRILNSQTGEVVRELPALATPATRIAVSPNGTLIFCGHADGRISIVSMADGAVTGQLAGHAGAVTDIVPLGDSQSLYSASADGTTRLWKVPPAAVDGQIVAQTPLSLWDSGTPGPSFLYASNDGQTVWVADGSGKANLRSAADGTIAKTLETNSPTVEFVASSNGQILALATADRHVRTYRNDGTLLKDLTVPTDVRCLNLNADGSRLLAGLADGSIQVFEPTKGDLLETFRDHAAMTAVRGARFGADNLTVLSCGDDRTVRLQKCSCFQVTEAGAGQREVTLIPASGTQSLHMTSDGKVVLKNLQNGNVDREFKLPAPMTVTALAIRPDGQRVAAGTSTGDVVVWNMNNGETVVQTVKTAQPVSSLFWSSDSRRLTAVGSETMELFGPSLPNVQPAVELVPYQQIVCSHRIRRAMFSSDGRTVFVGLENGTAEEWACAAPEQRRQFNHGGPVYGVAISADGNTVVSCSTDQTVRVWDVLAGQQKFQLNGHQGPVHSVAMNPDESLAVSSGADGTLRLWDIVGGRQLKQLITFNATMYSVAIHPGGQIIAAAGADRKIHLVDLTTGAEIRTMTGHTDFVHSVAFSPDGSQLMSYGYAGQLKIWNTADGAMARETRRGRVGNSARYSQDGQKIVIGNGDGTASVFGAGLQ